MDALKKGSEIELPIESLAFGGEGVGRIDGFVVFVSGALPGQRIRARIVRKKKNHAVARLLSVMVQTPDVVPASCPHFPTCGGCALQHFAYEKQLAAKSAQVSEVVGRLGGLKHIEILPCLPSPQIFFYRNKMEYTFSPERWLTPAEMEVAPPLANKGFALGLHVKGFYNKIIQIEECHLQSPLSNEVRNFVAEAASASKFRPYTTRDHSGFWRFLVIREGKNSGEMLVNLITAPGDDEAYAEVKALASALIEKFPALTTVLHTINRTRAQVAAGEEVMILHGTGYIHEYLGKWRFRISAASFFQTNTRGAEQLYETVAVCAGLTGNEVVYDLYCGTGSIGIYLSDRARFVVGIEAVPAAIQDAQINAELNGARHCAFVCGDLKDTLQQTRPLLAQYGRPDVVVLDPPRAGVHEKALERIIQLAPSRIVYVSCNPATFARDARLLGDAGFDLNRLQPVDMFPHTPHIELVGLFQPRGVS